jgi:hypothetical protein
LIALFHLCTHSTDGGFGGSVMYVETVKDFFRGGGGDVGLCPFNIGFFG